MGKCKKNIWNFAHENPEITSGFGVLIILATMLLALCLFGCCNKSNITRTSQIDSVLANTIDTDKIKLN